ncbi:hypothetical protein BC628DRAFT_418888 [Trametes gibbosa]|nr:hypothetical protein BC628DRAFT_418888 [Trametes gibbosa]
MSQVNKITAERSQRTLLELVAQPGNDVCADCKSRNPRWASYNLGIFICVSCASIHRKMGTHISKVKSLTLDSWTKEQVEVMKTTGNAKSNAHFNPDEVKHPPPTNMIDSERDSDLEKYIRAKYEYKSFVSRSAQVAALLGPSRSSSSRLSPAPVPPRSRTVPVPTPPTSTLLPSAAPSIPPSVAAPVPAATQSQLRSVSQPVAPSLPPSSQYSTSQPQTGQPPPAATNPLWNDLAQLQAPSLNSSLPLQYAPPMATPPISIPGSASGGLAPPNFNAYGVLSASPISPYPSSFMQQSSPGGGYPGEQARSLSLNTGLSGGGYGGPGMGGASPSMLHPQQTSYAMGMQATTPSPGGFMQQTGAGMSSTLAPSSYGQQQFFHQQMQQSQPQPQSQSQLQGSPMFATQPLQYAQGSPMFQPQSFGEPQMQMNGGAYMPQQPQQPQQQQYGAPQQQQFMGGPVSYGQPMGMPQQQQQPMYGQGNAFGGTGWQPQQQHWGGGM